ncbi:hypothetical protein M407DRAFT_23321 [Tulasnella calospora MUT 4182]|uniref:Uncharacterized protein n=1 Tax=Tulasnella calospora MUT 4182 TaxID=1051891 RepID=A0A0C3QLC0_9AGAM|nr:hypothetical protein M407DRAFT_23321 [Tulasnella calospora MUT 4182]
MSVVSLLKLSCDQLLARARQAPFKQIDSWRISVGLRVAKRDKDTVSAALVDYFLSCLSTEVLFAGGTLSSDAEDRLRRYFGNLLDILLVDEAVAELDRQRMKEQRRLKEKESQRARRAAEDADARSTRLEIMNASHKESRRAAAAAISASAVRISIRLGL